MQRITPNLWFNTQAEEAANFYVSVFGDGRITDVTRYGPDSPGPEGQVMTVTFELQGQRFVAINGGPEFSFTEAVSFEITCGSQEEVDHYWDSLVEEGQEAPCGWLKDRYGLSWQVTPTELVEMISDPDPAKAQRAVQAMLATFGKFDIAKLRAAYEGA